MDWDLEEAMRRVLHRCAYLQVSIREGMPAHVVLVQIKSLQKNLEVLLPLLEAKDEHDLQEEIKMKSLSEAHEEALADLMGVTDADTDPDTETYPPEDWT